MTYDTKTTLIDPAHSPLGFSTQPEMYYAVLGAYFAELPEQLSALQEAFDAKDLALLATHAHGLKSAHAYIGAPHVQHMAWEIERAGKAGNGELMAGLFPDFMRTLRALAEEIGDRFADELDLTDGTFCEAGTDAPDPTLLAHLRRACDAVDAWGAEEALKQLNNGRYPEPTRKILCEIQQKIAVFDYEACAALIDSLL